MTRKTNVTMQEVRSTRKQTTHEPVMTEMKSFVDRCKEVEIQTKSGVTIKKFKALLCLKIESRPRVSKASQM